MQIAKTEENGITIISVDGEVDLTSSPELRSAFDELIDAKVKKVVVDFEKSDYIDSSCLATLIEMQERMEDIEGDMAIANISDRVKSIFEITKVDKLFKIFDSKQEALEQI